MSKKRMTAEFCATNRTFMGLFSSVSSHVVIKSSSFTEFFATNRTFMGLFASVSSHVVIKISSFTEFWVTNRTFMGLFSRVSSHVVIKTSKFHRILCHKQNIHGAFLQCEWWDGIVGSLTWHEAYGLCLGNHTGHNLHTRGWGDMKMKSQPHRDLNPVPLSQWKNHATN